MPGNLWRFFEPLTVAVVGASREQGKIGNTVLKNILEGGYKGTIFPINPKASEILGLKTYPSITDVPLSIDLMVVVIPSDFVQSVMQEAARKGVKAAVIISGGFREIGQHGKELEKSVMKTAKESNIRIIGPNCQGVNDTYSGLCATFGGLTHRSGSVSIISQSGTVSAALQCWADIDNIGISKCINLGNKIDVNEMDLLQYLKDDDRTKVIALYIEGVTDGTTFMNVAKEVSAKKPIVTLKGGMTQAGFKAMLSHTSSLASSPDIFAAAFKQSGIIQLNNIEQFYDAAKAFSYLPSPKGRGVLIVESTGGAGILAADWCERLGLRLTEPEEQAKNNLRKKLPDICTFSNPFDLTTEGFKPDRFAWVIEENMNNNKYHAFITIFGDPIENAAEEIKKVSTKTDKPIIVVYLGGGQVELAERTKMHSMGIPVFPTPERAVNALHAMVKYAEYLEKTNDPQK